MRTVGIVAEYNPFHYGHLYHIRETRDSLGGDTAVVCVMSGDFVQRGEPASYSKFARAEAACRCGADVVIELPVPWALSSAEGFARGAVGTLCAMKSVDAVSFGSESGSVEEIRHAAKLIGSSEVQDEIRTRIGSGISYAKAMREALALQDEDAAMILDAPNNILAVEYMRYLLREDPEMEVITVRRTGAGHDEHGSDPIQSASALRETIRKSGLASADLPEEALRVYRRQEEAGRVFQPNADLETAILSRLRMLDRERFEEFPDCGGGIGNAVYKAIRQKSTLAEIAMEAKSKAVTLARIRRVLMNASLNIRSEAADGIPPYARVLAFSEKGREVLKTEGEIPFLTKAADVDRLGARAQKIFEITSQAHDLYVLGYRGSENRQCGQDWRTGPYLRED